MLGLVYTFITLNTVEMMLSIVVQGCNPKILKCSRNRIEILCLAWATYQTPGQAVLRS